MSAPDGTTAPKASAKRAPGAARLGRLTVLGPTEIRELPFLLPNGWDDLRTPVTRFRRAFEDGERYAILGQLDGLPEVRRDGTVRVSATLIGEDGERLTIGVFGNVDKVRQQLLANPREVCVLATASVRGTNIWMNNVSLVSEAWIDTVRPRYPASKGSISADMVLQRMFEMLPEAIPAAERWLCTRLAPLLDIVPLEAITGEPGLSLRQILWDAHFPFDIAAGERAHRALDCLAAADALTTALESSGGDEAASWHKPADWKKRAAALPFALTDEQRAAVRDIHRDLSAETAMRRLLSGDVGTGKTAVCASAWNSRPVSGVIGVQNPATS